jgi:predicted pyridoxine 5'-phosphate oxidase superfamily flavin-nucleotide-binding protein
VDTLWFHAGEQQAQQRWQTASLWDKARRERLLWRHIPHELHARLELAPFFFLATSDDQGHCDCSFKGGGPGIIRVLSGTQFVFPDFDGNGAFMSLGNILLNPNVGCLFIDFSDGGRLRVNGKASIHERGEGRDELMDIFPKASRVILIDVEQVVPNCAQHIPLLEPVKQHADKLPGKNS